MKTYGSPDFTIYNAGAFPANRYTAGMTSSTSVAINFATHEMVILGTEYAGEMKKGIFTVMFYLMPVKYNVLTLHSSANEGKNGDVTLFFGLSGTGKTTLSTDPNRALIGDDEHCWSEHGVFNIEGGCYAKVFFPLKQNLIVVYRTLRRKGARDLQRHPFRFGSRERRIRSRNPCRRLRRLYLDREHSLRISN